MYVIGWQRANQRLLDSGIAAKALIDFLGYIIHMHKIAYGHGFVPTIKDEPVEYLNLDQCKFGIAYLYNWTDRKVSDFEIAIDYPTKEGKSAQWTEPAAVKVENNKALKITEKDYGFLKKMALEDLKTKEPGLLVCIE